MLTAKLSGMLVEDDSKSQVTQWKAKAALI